MTYKEIRKMAIDACLLPGYDEPAIKAAWREACLAVREGRMRISEFCGLTIHDLDMENLIINIVH